jgi:hypothetical protein
MAPLSTLLHGVLDREPRDEVLEEEEDGFEISEEDVQSNWDGGALVSDEVARQVWEDMLRQIEDVDGDDLGSEHIEVGGTERAYDDSP